METINVISYENTSSIGIGTTEPFIAKGEDGNDYVTKVYDVEYQSYGAKHLINEYISYKIAKRLGLPIPPAKLLQIPDEFENNTDRPLISKLGFGSKYINKAQSSLNEVLMEHIVNKHHFADILFFDQFLLNNDRAENDGNLLVDMKERKIFMIDHTHILFDNLSWTEKTIRENFDTWLVRNFNGHIYKLLLKYINGHSPFHRIISNIKSELTTEFIQSVVDTIPNEWDIKTNEKTALIDFLEHKIQHILRVAEEIQNRWPNIVGYS